MKKLIREGEYSLVETKKNTKVLILDKTNIYPWIEAEGIGEILIASGKKHTIQNILSIGKYKIYSVENEKDLTDLEHLELEVGKKKWQGYLLTNGLPTKNQKRHRIIPTQELISDKTDMKKTYDNLIEKAQILGNNKVRIA